MSVIDRVFTGVMVAAAIVLIVSLIRSRRVNYRDIKESEINPDVAAGEELLHDAMLEDERVAERSAVGRDVERR